jgi:hypothetical protein
LGKRPEPIVLPVVAIASGTVAQTGQKSSFTSSLYLESDIYFKKYNNK